MATLEARATITATDETGPAFDSVRARIAALQSSAGQIAAAIDQINNVAREVSPVSSTIGAAAGQVTAAAAATRALLDQYAGLEAQLANPANAAAEAQTRLRDQINLTKQALAEQGVAAAKSSDQLAAAVEKEDQAQRRRAAIWKEMGNALPLAGPLILHGAKDAAMAGAELQHSRVEMEKVGMGADEIAAIEARSLALSGQYGNVGQVELMDRAKEMRSIVRQPEEALQMLDTVAAATAVLRARGLGDQEGNLIDLLKGGENLGAGKDPARLTGLVDDWLKSMQVLGQTISPASIFDFARMARSAGAVLSDRFLTTTAQSLNQEMTGGMAGRAVASLYRELAGGFQGSHGAIKEFVRLGLIPESDVDLLKTGEAKGLKAGAQPAWLGQVSSDPDLWTWNVLKPALEKAGYTSLIDQQAEVRKMFPNQMAADMVSKLLAQQPTYGPHAAQMGAATGLAGAALNVQDPIAQMQALGEQVKNFAAALSSPAMQSAGSTLGAIASGVGSLAQAITAFNKAHPDIAQALSGGALTAGFGAGGYLSLRLLSGIGSLLFGSAPMTGAATALGGSAAALTSAAAALTGAAAKLGVEGAAPGLAKDIAPAVAASVGWRGILGGVATMAGAMAAIAAIPTLTTPEEDAILAADDEKRRQEAARAAQFHVDSIVNRGGSWLAWLNRNRAESALAGSGYRGDDLSAEESRESSRGRSLSAMRETAQTVSLDPNSKVQVTVRVDASSSLINATATATASGNAAVGVSTAGVAPNGHAGL